MLEIDIYYQIQKPFVNLAMDDLVRMVVNVALQYEYIWHESRSGRIPVDNDVHQLSSGSPLAVLKT